LSDCGAARSVDLAVHPDNVGAVALYTSFGFRGVRRVENFFGDGEPRLSMVLSIA
jgi:ribosomal protein S18 acetylase RimI-like enzyme